MATFASYFVSPFYTFVLFCPILNLPRCLYNKHSDSKIVLNLPRLRLNFPTDIERERGKNKMEGAKYFSVFSIFRSCWKKNPHLYPTRFSIYKADKNYSFVIEILYVHLYAFVKTKTRFPSKIIFYSFICSVGLLQQFKMAASILFYWSSPMESSLTCSRHSRPLLM